MITKDLLKFYFLSAVSILIISFISLYPSFGLAFQDDDWRGVLLPKTDYADGRLFTPYGIQLWFCGFLYDFFDSNFYLYYILSFILRTLVAFGVLIFIFTLTQNRFVSFLGALLVAVTVSGLQTTYETASTNVYICLLFFLIFLTIFFKSLDKFSYKSALVLSLSLILASLASPVRAYPLFAWAIIVYGIRLLLNFNKLELRFFLNRFLIITVTFLILYQVGLFKWFSLDAASQNKINDLSTFSSIVGGFISNLNYSIFLNFVRSLGNIIFPSIWDKSGVISTVIGGVLLIVLTVCFYLLIKRKSQNLQTIFAFLLWPVLFFASYFIVILAGYSSGKETIVLDSFRRYLLPPFIGFSIFLAVLLSLTQKGRINTLLKSAVIILIFVHAIATYTFLYKLSIQRDGPYMKKIWEQFTQVVPEASLSSGRTNLFYLETDGSARAIYTINDGFILHTTIMYNIPPGLPSKSSDKIKAFSSRLRHTIYFEELLSFIKNGLPGENEPLTWERIFALRVEGEKLIDIKEEVKKRVEATLAR